MKGFCPLASGSKGNCLYVGTQQTKVLIDAGISTRSLLSKLSSINVDISEIDAVFITHEHSDHIQGLKTLAFKYKIPVFANHETAKGIVESIRDCPKFKIFSTGETFEFGDFEIHPFSIQHDTLDPVAFTFRTAALELGFCTDLGRATPLVQRELNHCHYLVLEANHEPSMVHASARPDIYKKRVLSPLGHLSNEACAQLLSQIHAKVRHVHLAHLSSECNTPETAISVIKKILVERGIDLDLSIAYQDRVSKAVYF